MDRGELLAPLIAAVRSGTNMLACDIEKYFDSWELIPAYVDGAHVATAAMLGSEIHFALIPGWRPQVSYRGVIREFLAPLLARNGYLTTRVPHVRSAQKRFVQRLGFKPTWSDSEVQYFMLGHEPFER